VAERPVFIPWPDKNHVVRQVSVSFAWHPGMAPSQKRKNVAALHRAAASQGLAPLLEISTKSDVRLGQDLSAFNLRVPFEVSPIPLECAFQGSKVFEKGGPFTDLYSADVRDAKRDPRLRDSGRLVAFKFGRVQFPTVPMTAFYDWLYLRALTFERHSLKELRSFAGFTDIEFNPEHSINCQARSCATVVALDEKGLVEECLESPGRLIQLVAPDAPQQQTQLFDNLGARYPRRRRM
jgi:hypothetical protein